MAGPVRKAFKWTAGKIFGIFFSVLIFILFIAAMIWAFTNYWGEDE